MEETCRWLYGRQSYSGTVNHTYDLSTVKGSREDRKRRQVALLQECRSDLFMLTDDDDYVDPGFLERAVLGLQNGMYGEMARRTYLLSRPSYGESSVPPELPFVTMMVFDRAQWRKVLMSAIRSGTTKDILRQGPTWSMSGNWIIMRGMMKDSGSSITTWKNFYSNRHFPNKDPNLDQLRAWLADDPEAFQRYREIAKTRVAETEWAPPLPRAMSEGEIKAEIGHISDVDPAKTYLEIGSLAGGSLWHFGGSMSKGATLVSVDKRKAAKSFTKSLGAVCRQLRARDFRVEQVTADSHDYSTVKKIARLTSSGVDVLFIDGDHAEGGVRADVRNYAPMVRPGGLVIFHDCGEGNDKIPGVRKVFLEFASGKRHEVVQEQAGLGFVWV